MLELLGGLGSGRMYVPWSGPGTKYITKGNLSLGYFGEVSALELFDGWELLKWGGISPPTVYTNSGLVWLKFARDNKIIFIAKQVVSRGTSWADLYNAGLVYGERGFGKYPVGSGVDQFKVKGKSEDGRSWPLKIRLMKGYESDPAAPDTTPYEQSEYDQLFLRALNLSGKPYYGTFDKIPESATINSSAPYWCVYVQESYLGKETTDAALRGYINNTTGTYQDSKTASSPHNWRPVIELVDPNVLLEPDAVVTSPIAIRPVMDSYDAEGSEAIVSPKLVNVAPYSVNALPVTYALATDTVTSPRLITTQVSQLKDFGLRTDYVAGAYEPSNVSWSVSNLKPISPRFTVS